MTYDELLQRALDDLQRLQGLERDRYKRWLIARIMRNVEDGALTFEDALEEAKMIGVRNPAFDGDMVGWLDDDFDDSDEDEED
jgi:hypothetical protein